MRRSPPLAWAALAWAALTLFRTSEAAAADVVVAVVMRVGSDADRALLERVRGQTSDMSVVLHVAPYQQIEASLPEQLAAADAEAERVAAEAVIYWSREPDGWILYVVKAARGRVLVRRLGDTADLPSSATLEMAALVIRGALQALSAGVPVGLERDDLPARAPPAPPPAPPVAVPVVQVQAVPQTKRANVEFVVALAAAGWRDGQSHYGQEGGELRVGLTRGRVSFGALGVLGPGATLDDGLATVHIARQMVAAYAGVAAWSPRSVRLELGLRAGAAFFSRATTATGPTVQATPNARSNSAAVGPLVLVNWFARRFGLSIEAGCDYLSSPPVLGYSLQGGFVRSRPLSHLSPYVTFGVAYRFRRVDSDR
jgi:hypothetical protein